MAEQITPKPTSKVSRILTILIAGVMLVAITVLSGIVVYLYKQNKQLESKLLTAEVNQSSKNGTIAAQKKDLAEKVWESPSKKKTLWYEYFPERDTYQLHLYDGIKTVNVGRTNEPVTDLDVSWSPNEDYVVISDIGDIDRIVCTNYETLHCSGKTVFMSYEGFIMAYWSSDETAFIRYNDSGADVISKLKFIEGTIYPQETVIYKEPWHAFFAYRPVSVSPNERYLILKFAYEGLPTLSFMDTRTGEIKSLATNNSQYIVDTDPHYSWKGNALTFEGIYADQNQSWADYVNEDQQLKKEALKQYTVNINAIK